ncbi:hypothetical protein [Flavonifractor sp. An306]|uniref:hypothetical protein n=1 Tax=Flavonifractor sp. An306 TaxID=1965629 RepID=UPI000B3A0DD7|nr:hypothetical protein [Flavonifractor sp. An306]OUO42279.1 hypothetical protein B5F88_04640 [Flavonifractor sp. An306]
MFEHEYQSRFDAVAPSPELVADTKIRLRAALAGKQRPRRHLTRRGLAALAAAAVLTVSALAAAPAVWQTIQKDLGNRAPCHRQARLALNREELPAQTLESSVTDTGVTVLQPDQNHMALEKDGAVSISSMGFAADGRYHVRFVQEGTIFPLMDNGSPCYVEYYLYDPENPDRWPQQDVGDVICTAVQDGWDVCLPSLTPDTLKYLELVQLRTEYAAGGGRLEGNWKITVPVEVMALRAATPATTLVFPYTHGGEMPFGHDWDARLKQLTVSPLSVCADFVTPEGQEYPCQLTGTELSLLPSLWPTAPCSHRPIMTRCGASGQVG